MAAQQGTSQQPSSLKGSSLESHEGLTITARPWTDPAPYKEKFPKKSPFEAVVVGGQHGLLKSGAAECINQVAALAQGIMQSRGCVNMSGLADKSQEIFGSSVSYAFAEAAARTGPKFEWLDRENGWFGTCQSVTTPRTVWSIKSSGSWQ